MMKTSIKNLVPIAAAFILSLLLSSCSLRAESTNLTEIDSSAEACSEGQPIKDSTFADLAPDCSCITSSEEGPRWRDLTIGKSSLDDVRLTLGEDGSQSPLDGGWQFMRLSDPVDWLQAEACFSQDRLSALYIAWDDKTRDLTLDQLIRKYGNPDRVTWGATYQSRALIWSERGLLISVMITGDPEGQILLYPPFSSEALDDSWVLASLPDGPIGSPSDDVDFDFKLDLEDPWGIER
jgi:hypothetical protein